MAAFFILTVISALGGRGIPSLKAVPVAEPVEAIPSAYYNP